MYNFKVAWKCLTCGKRGTAAGNPATRERPEKVAHLEHKCNDPILDMRIKED